MTAQANTRWQWVTHALRTVPVDLLVVVGSVWLVAIGVHYQVTGRFVQFLLGCFVLFFAPGYVLVAALFPRRAVESTGRGTGTGTLGSFGPTLSGGERALLSFGTSVALLPGLGLVLGIASLWTGGNPYSLFAIAATLALFGTVGAVVAWLRRLRLPHEHRFALPLSAWGRDFRAFLTGGSTLTSAVNVVLVASIVVALGAGAYAVAAPQPSPGYTDFALLTENESGEYVTSGYPTEMTQGQSADLVAQVDNQRDEPREYTVVAELQQVRTGDERLEVLSEREVARFQVTADAGESVYRPHTVEPQQAGEDLRLAYYLYEGEAPEDASASTADRNLYLWTNVTASP